MKRSISAVAVLLAVTMTTTGCGAFGGGRLGEAVEYHFEVTGGKAEKIDYTKIVEDESVGTYAVPAPALPWKIAGIAYPGAITVTVTPTEGVPTCRIIVEKKVLAEKKGAAGVPLTCSATAEDE